MEDQVRDRVIPTQRHEFEKGQIRQHECERCGLPIENHEEFVMLIDPDATEEVSQLRKDLRDAEIKIEQLQLKIDLSALDSEVFSSWGPFTAGEILPWKKCVLQLMEIRRTKGERDHAYILFRINRTIKKG